MQTDELILRLGDVDDLRRPGVGGLMVDHFCEVGRDSGCRNLDPHWERYEALEDAERLVIWVVECDGDVVGYSLSLLCDHMHNRQQLQLVNDSLFVQQSMRNRGVGNLLMRATEEAALEYGADMIWHAPAHSRLDRILAGSKAYRPTITSYIKKAEDHG